jgi:hypothetical protein
VKTLREPSSSISSCFTYSTKYGAVFAVSDAGAATTTSERAAATSSSELIIARSRMRVSTALRRSRASAGSTVGENRDGERMTPASSAASGRVSAEDGLPK